MTRLSVDVYQTQADFVTDTSRYTAFIGGRNSGKTFAGSLKALTCAGRGGLGCIAAPNFPMLEHGAKRQFIDRLDAAEEPYVLNRSGMTIPRFKAEVIFVTLESESRVRGPNYAWAWADEVEYISDRKLWKALKGAVRDGTNPQLFVTTTPKGRRLVWDEWVLAPTAAHALYRATTFDNPFIDAEDYVAGLGYEGAFYEQEITADFVSFEGLVYPAFDRLTHVQEVDCTRWGTVIGLDVGTRNPTALLTIRYAGDRIHVERELYRRGMGSSAIVDAVVLEAEHAKPDYVIVDPSAAGIITDLNGRGVTTRKANNDVIVGISRVTSALANLTVDPSCVNTIAEFESYQYPDGGKAERDAPIKANDHALDVVRYVTMDLTGGRLIPTAAPVGLANRSDWR